MSSDIITLGIGTPSGIPEFLLGGLSASGSGGGLTPGFQAYQYAISGLCRSGATRSDYYNPIGQVQIAGTLRSRTVDKTTLRINDYLHALPNTATFECVDFMPTRGQEVIISLGTITNRIFAGHIVNVAQQSANRHQRIRYRVDCVDYTWLLETRRITGVRFTNESATNIVTSLMGSFAPPGFNTANVEASLDPVDFTANHGETLMQAINRLMKMASIGSRKGGYAYVDYNKGLHAFVTPETGNNPSAITDTATSYWALQYREDFSQTRSRTYVMGAVTQTRSAVPSGSASVPVEETSFFGSSGGRALSFGNELVYTAVSPSSGPGWLTGVTSFAYTIPQGESVRVMAVAVNSNAARSIQAWLGGSSVTTGLVDHVIADERLSDAGARDRADADIALNSEPESGLVLVSRDKFMRSGKTLAVSLTVPTTIAKQYVLQSVEITDVSVGQANPAFPRRRIDAATTAYDLNRLLQTADRLSTEGSS